MAGKLLGRILFAVAYVLLASHDFVPHRHLEIQQHQHAHHHEGHQHHDQQGLDFDVIGLFAHSHGADQTSNIYFNQAQDQLINCNAHQAAADIGVKYEFCALSTIFQSGWPEYTCAKAPPDDFSFRQLRAPPISSFTC